MTVDDTLFFARKLEEAGYHLGPVVVNRVHPGFVVEGAASPTVDPCHPNGWELLSWAGERDRKGLVELAKLFSREQPLVDVPLMADEPIDLPALEALGRMLEERLSAWQRYVSRTS